jgi:DNA-binding NarL/FixJ family response regulator
MSIKVMIVDDHEVVADGLRCLVNSEVDMEVIDCMHESREAVRHIIEEPPDIVLMDHAMPGLNGTEATTIIRERCPKTKVVILSMYSDRIHVMGALQAGAAGYVLKTSAAKEVVEAIRAVHYGGHYLCKRLAKDLIDRVAGKPITQDPVQQLSSRERQVLKMLAEGRAMHEIAATMALSEKTVATYRTRMMRKLKIDDVATLVRFAIQNKIISVE